MLSSIITSADAVHSGAETADTQVKITERIPLLDKDGRLTKPGYCFTNMYEYDRRAVKANPLRIKEWDFYQISNSKYVMQITFADISMGAMANVNLFDIETGEKYESNLDLRLLSLGRMKLSKDAMKPGRFSSYKQNFDLVAEWNDKRRNIKFRGKCGKKDFTADLSMELFENHESLIMAVPFSRGNGRQFYLNQKMNCMPVKGTATVGELTVRFDPEDSFCVLDWGRGVWPFHCIWYWGNGSHRMENGDIFGFEIGWGFGDMSAAGENTLFYNGKAHKIGEIYCINDETDWLKPWKFKSNDGRFDMTMIPVYDNVTKAKVGPVGNLCHQVFGRWSGTAVLDDGTVIEINNMTAFCEKSDNKW